MKAYIHSFFFSSTIAQLWYLPALAVAVLLVWTGYRAGLGVRQLLVLTGVLFVFGCICDNWYFTERAPMKIQESSGGTHQSLSPCETVCFMAVST